MVALAKSYGFFFGHDNWYRVLWNRTCHYGRLNDFRRYSSEIPLLGMMEVIAPVRYFEITLLRDR